MTCMKKNLCEGTCDQDARLLFENEDSIAYRVENEEGELTITE